MKVPGFSFASAWNSLKVLAGTSVESAIICGASPIAATGTRSFMASNGICFWMKGLMTRLPLSASPSVVPSGAAFATASMPSVPAAPVRFSTTACWPVVRVM